MSMIWSSRERNRSCSLVSRRSRGRIANPRSISSSEKNHGLRFEGILEIDFLSGPNHPAHSIVFKFFTDDCLIWRENELTPQTPRYYPKAQIRQGADRDGALRPSQKTSYRLDNCHCARRTKDSDEQ